MQEWGKANVDYFGIGKQYMHVAEYETGKHKSHLSTGPVDRFPKAFFLQTRLGIEPVCTAVPP